MTSYIFYSGKGGTGKTSCAAATALHFADKGRKVLIISTDPAHSLSDSFETHIGGEVKMIRDNLYAVEIDPKKAVEEYKQMFSSQIKQLSSFGVGESFDLAAMTPGIDEIAAFDKFLQYMQTKDYDVIVFDTAPTGHTLRLLSLPDVLKSWVGKLIKWRMQLAGVADMFKKIMPFGQGETHANTDVLEQMKRRIEEAKKILTNPRKTSYNIVTLAEEMSILESERALQVLNEYRIPVKAVVVNQLVPNNPCAFCQSKRKQQQGRLKTIRKKFRGKKIIELPAYPQEMKGDAMLRKLAKQLLR